MASNGGRFAAGAIAAVAMLAGAPVQAQQGEAMSQDEVVGFFDDAEQELTRMVEAGELDGLMDWIEEGLADEARFAAGVDTYIGDSRKGFSAFAMDKSDVTRLGRIAVGVLAGVEDPQEAIQDYTLDIEVREVVAAGPDAATVTTRITESATLAVPAGGDADEATGAAAPGRSGESVSVEATADCQHLVRRGESEDALLIGLTACQVETRF